MRALRSIILDMAGGMMNTALLNFLTWIIGSLIIMVVGVVCYYIVALLTADNKTHETTIIDDAQ